LSKKNQNSESDRLHQLEKVFLELLDRNNGRVTVLRFAIASNLSLEASKNYLDRKAAILNGTFEVSEEGGINYLFNVD
jgi:hypothetical protein